MYSVAENGSSAQLVIIKEGRIDWTINLNFATSDCTAISTSKLMHKHNFMCDYVVLVTV